METIQKLIQTFSGKSERKKPLGKPIHKWEDNNKMDLKDMGCDARH